MITKNFFLAFYCWSNSFLSQKRFGYSHCTVTDYHACNVHNVPKYLSSIARNCLFKIYWYLVNFLSFGPFCCFHHPSLYENGKAWQRDKETDQEWRIDKKKTKNYWRQGLHKKICSIPCAFWYCALCVLLCFSCSLLL